MRYVISWQLLQHLIGEPQHGCLPRLATPTPAVLRLDVDDGAQCLIGHVRLIGYVSIRMETKHLLERGIEKKHPVS